MWLRTLRDTVQQGGFEVVVHETVVADFLRRLEVKVPDVALIDLRMPPGNEDEGISLAHQLRDQYPRMGIAIVSGLEGPLRHKFVESKLEDTRGGLPIGFLYKDRLTPDSLHSDLLKIARGEAVVDSTVLYDAMDTIVQTQRGQLTDVEERLMGYVAQGWRDDKIAEALAMSSATVERLSRRTFDKLLGRQQSRENRRVRASVEWLRRRREL